MTESRIPIRNIYYLFCYAWDRFEEAQSIATGGEAAPDLPNLLARVLAEGTKSLLRRGLDRNYLPLEEELRTIRGHIELGPTLQLQARRARRVDCTFDELSHDLLHNQLLKASLRRLAKLETLDPSLASKLNQLWRRMPGVTDIRLSAGAFARVQLHRSNARYDLLLRVCALAFDCMIPAQKGGGFAFQDVLRDERKMARVFEAFVRNFYRRRQTSFRVKPLQLEWQAKQLWNDGAGRLPSMITDVYLESEKRRIIIDTKYYAEALQERHGSTSFHSNNVYQLFAYLRNDAIAYPALVIADGMLLYPEVQHSLDAAYELHGHRVRIATVDLAQDWAMIEARLQALINPAEARWVSATGLDVNLPA